MKALNFIKMHGIGNDFIVVRRECNELLQDIIKEAVMLCDRRKGIGADGILFLIDSEDADYQVRIINSDGSEAEMCGNGIRCCALYAKRLNINKKEHFTFDTLAGKIETEVIGSSVRVTMSKPRVYASEIPVDCKKDLVLMHDLLIGDKVFKINAISMGNPHAVIYADSLSDELVLGYGPKIEKHPFFPKKTNVEFIKILSDHEIQMRVWERGCGETQACGTGACASVVSGIINKLHGNSVTVHLPGGNLNIEWNGDLNSPVYMTGPAVAVYTGVVEL